MHTESGNLVSMPGLTVTEREWAEAEQLPSLLAGLYQQVTGRRLCVAGQRPDAQHAVKVLARGLCSPTNVHWA